MVKKPHAYGRTVASADDGVTTRCPPRGSGGQRQGIGPDVVIETGSIPLKGDLRGIVKARGQSWTHSLFFPHRSRLVLGFCVYRQKLYEKE